MSHSIDIRLQVPDDLAEFHLPEGVQKRLQELLDRQDQGYELTSAERKEAEGLSDLADLLSLLRIRTKRLVRLW